MSAFKFLQLGTVLSRETPKLLSPLSFHPKTLRFIPYSSSAALETITSGSTEAQRNHPWPEWVTFIDRLKTKGYFMDSSPKDDDEFVSTQTVYCDMNALKDVCLSFARDRYDVFKSLSTEDIQTVVERGCPNLFRKTVNSAKRLRAYVRLDEGDVCGACNLRGSCDRAYVILKETEAVARTVDIVRLLLFYALDPQVVSGGEKPPGRDIVESSARKLISELTELSGKSRDPALPEPDVKASPKKGLSSNIMDDKLSGDVEMKRGDWMCPKCNFMNFARNVRCLKCSEDGPKRVGGGDVELKKGDWTCPECNFINFSRNLRCLKCNEDGPKRVGGGDVEMKKGDWTCPECSFMNFASNRNCLRCREKRPKRQLNPGEWECPSCDFLNYKRNMVCLKCNCDRPKEKISTEYDEQLWRRP